MGLIFTTSGWTGASITFAHADGTETYTVAADVLNPYDVAQALVAWLDDAGRVWSAHVSGVAFAVTQDGARDQIGLTYTGTFTSITPDATWTARFGATSTPPADVPASCGSRPGSLVWARWDAGRGVRSREGAWRMGAASTSLRRPLVELGLTLAQSYALDDARRSACQPREAYLYDEMDAVWRYVSVGEVRLEHPEPDRSLVRGTVQVLGGL